MSVAGQTAARCGRCAFCVASCPVFDATLRQALGPRAKVFLLQRLLDGEADMTPQIAEAFQLCTHCGQCEATCPAGVPVLDFVDQGRGMALERGAGPPGLSTALTSLQRDQNPLGHPRAKRRDLWPEDVSPPEPGQTLFWAGCMAAYQDVKVLPATLKIFEALGEPVHSLAGGEGCCGYPVWLAGDRSAFEVIARRNQEALAAPARIVTPCAGCLAAFERIYPESGVETAPVVHFIQWLAEKLAQAAPALREPTQPQRVIYHDPCDLGRRLGVYDPPRQVLQALPGIQLLEFNANRDAAKCCGGGGGLKGVDLELSLTIAEKRALEAVRQNADAIVTACPSCKQNLAQAAARLKKKGLADRRVKVKDVSEIAAESLGPKKG